MKVQALTVAMNGDLVGTLYWDGTGAMSFEYTPEWLSEPSSRAISLSLPGLGTMETKKRRQIRLFPFIKLHTLVQNDVL